MMGEERIDKLMSFLKDNPEDLFVLFAIAKEFEKQGKWLEARQQYEQVLKLDPTYLGLYFHYVQNLIKNEMFDQAAEILELGTQEARNQKDQKSLSELMELASLLPDA